MIFNYTTHYMLMHKALNNKHTNDFVDIKMNKKEIIVIALISAIWIMCVFNFLYKPQNTLLNHKQNNYEHLK